MLSPGAVAELEGDFDDSAGAARGGDDSGGPRGRWRFEQRQGPIPDELIAAAVDIRGAHPGDAMVIIAGS